MIQTNRDQPNSQENTGYFKLGFCKHDHIHEIFTKRSFKIHVNFSRPISALECLWIYVIFVNILVIWMQTNKMLSNSNMQHFMTYLLSAIIGCYYVLNLAHSKWQICKEMYDKVWKYSQIGWNSWKYIMKCIFHGWSLISHKIHGCEIVN